MTERLVLRSRVLHHAGLQATSSTAAKPLVLSWCTGLFLFLAVVLLSLPQAALLPLLDRDEPRFAEASREMLQTGDFIVPTFNGAPRYAKPPLTYWCQAACFTVFGENAFAARLPSLLATAGTAVLLLAWGTQISTAAVGLGAALAYAFCLQTMQQGRVATADALLIFFMTLNAFAGWKLITLQPISHSSREYFWDTVLALGFAGGFLAKGPEALLPLAPMLICARGVRTRLFPEIVANFVLGLIVVLLWAIPAYMQTNGDYWRVGLSEGVGQRAISGLQGHGASTFGWYLLGLPLYFLLFWISALPWSVLLFLHRRKLFTAWHLDRADWYLLLNAALIFLVFTLMVTKLPHYTLPAFPFLVLLLARRMKSAGISVGTLAELGWTSGLGVAILTLIAVPLALAAHLTPSPAGELVRDARADLTPDTQFALVDFQEPNAIWELRRVSASYAETVPASGAVAFLQQPGPRALLLTSAAWDSLRGSADPSWTTFMARGWNTAKAWDSHANQLALLDLTLVIKK